MALMQIAEPGESPEPHKRKLGVGIDLGTTHSLVAAVRSGSAETLPDQDGRHLLPSVVHYAQGGEVQVGHDALAHTDDPLNTIASIKRLMGRGIADLTSLNNQLPYEFLEPEATGMPLVKTRAGGLSPVAISAEILCVLAVRAEQTMAADITGAVITVPAYFDDAQRQATKDAAAIAGLNVLRLINEPTAAAVAYGLDADSQLSKDGGRTIAVYDLGGGTFDISILRLQQGVFEVLSTGGDTALGGDDFDRCIAQWALKAAGWQGDLSPEQMAAVMRAARAAKECLSGQLEVSLNLESSLAWSGVLTRAEFEALVAPLVSKSIRSCKKALRDADLAIDEISEIVLVGGSTRMPCVRTSLTDFFAREPLCSIDPDKVVAVGAAIQADVLVGNKNDSDMLLLDVLPLSLGVETMGGLVEKIIQRNTPIPVAMAQEFTTYKDGQTAMAIHVLQGERDKVADCRSLARFELRGIPPMVAGAARIKVAYQVDADGLLGVTAEESTTGVQTTVQVKPSYGLEDSEVMSMLEQSFTHAKADMQARALQEQKVEAERSLYALEVALEKDGAELLSAAEREGLQDAMRKLQELAAGDDERAIEKMIEHLNEISGDFAARRMDGTIQRALAGHSVDELDAELSKDDENASTETNAEIKV